MAVVENHFQLVIHLSDKDGRFQCFCGEEKAFSDERSRYWANSSFLVLPELTHHDVGDLLSYGETEVLIDIDAELLSY